MCIFSGAVENVSSTNIFARRDGDYQYLVYSMNVESNEDVAMILPIPIVQGEKEIEFIDLSQYPKFFEYLSFSFPSYLSLRSYSLDDDSLKVHQVGSYEASFVPTSEDFDRLDQRFVIPKEAFKIREYSNYGFAVFKLKSGNNTFHPMAFKFKSGIKSLFYPTVHVHDGKLKDKDHFDHTLYAQSADPIIKEGWECSNVEVNIDFNKCKGIVDNDIAYKVEMHGLFDNKDIVV